MEENPGRREEAHLIDLGAELGEAPEIEETRRREVGRVDPEALGPTPLFQKTRHWLAILVFGGVLGTIFFLFLYLFIGTWLFYPPSPSKAVGNPQIIAFTPKDVFENTVTLFKLSMIQFWLPIVTLVVGFFFGRETQ